MSSTHIASRTYTVARERATRALRDAHPGAYHLLIQAARAEIPADTSNYYERCRTIAFAELRDTYRDQYTQLLDVAKRQARTEAGLAPVSRNTPKAVT